LGKPGPAGPADAQPSEEPFPALKREQREALEEIHASGAISASMSMSQLMHQDFRVSFPETKVVPIGDVADALGGEETPVGGIYVSMKNDIRGGILLVLPLDHICHLSDLLYGRRPGDTKTITDQELSGLMEMGNIISRTPTRVRPAHTA